jgi:Tfp pilus assembly protein PilF
LKLLRTGKDSALLRYSLANEYVKQGALAEAEEHLRRALELDGEYSAAWKLLGKMLEAAQRRPEALTVYRQGIEVAERKGDKQAAKEMTVFAKRLERAR